jgi:hypothetical protein
MTLQVVDFDSDRFYLLVFDQFEDRNISSNSSSLSITQSDEASQVHQKAPLYFFSRID